MNTLPSPPKTTIKSVEKAFNVLSEVARRPAGITASEVAGALEMPVPSAYHLLNTLTGIGALTKSRDRRYRLGPRIGAFGGAYYDQSEPDERLLAPMRRLAEETGETAYLTAWRGSDIEVLASAEGSHAVRVAGLERGSQGNAHARASGKLLLALSTPELRELYLANHALEALTDNTITKRKKLDAALSEIAELGYAVDEEEYTDGVSCVAVPLIYDDLVVGAYTISAPTGRFRRAREHLIESAFDAAAVAMAPGADPS